MSQIIRAVLQSTVWIAFVGLFGAALVKLDVSLALRLLLFTLAVALYMMFRDLHAGIAAIHETQTKLLYWLRTTYIAVEIKRLDSDNRQPSQDILIEDIKTEQQHKETIESLKRDIWLTPLGLLFGSAWLTYALIHFIGPLIVCAALVYFWDQLVVFLF